MQKKISTSPLDSQTAWGDAKNATKNIKGSGTKSIKKIWMRRLIRWDSRVKDIRAEIKDLRDEIDVRLRQERWKKVLTTLSEREQRVIQGFYWKEMNFAEMGNIYKVTRERIRHIFEKGMRKLRHPATIKMIREFDILLWEHWEDPIPKSHYKGYKKDYVPPKPYWVKVEFNEGVPRLVADVFYIWQRKPIIRKVYDAWIVQALEEHEIIH